MYSFIRPQKKNIISKLSKIWIFYITASVAIIAGYMGVVEAEKLYMTIQTEENIARKNDYQAQIARVQAELGIAQDQSAFANQIQAQNARITKTILSLFDLTPDQITLHSIEMHRDRLIISALRHRKKSIISYLKRHFVRFLTKVVWIFSHLQMVGSILSPSAARLI